MAVKALAYGAYLLLTEFIGSLPSHTIRNFLYKNVSRVSIGKHATLYRGARMRGSRKIKIGAGTSIGNGCELDGRGGLRFGRNVNVSSEAAFWTAQHDYQDASFATIFAPIEVCDWCWIGPRVTVLPGVTIAEGCVVAAHSVVTKSTDPYGVYAGIPAKRIGERTRHDFNYQPGAAPIPFI